ncbi:MAG: hypothetical protein ACP5F3_07945, partial [Candidatus Syntrophosphaera sp.]
MKTGRLLLLAVAVLMLAGIFACAGNKAEGELISYPKWWDTQGDKEFVHTYGMGTKVSQNLSIEAARANAMAEAARYVGLEIDNMVKNFEKEAGIYEPQDLALIETVTKVVSSVEFSGVQTGLMETRKDQVYGGDRFTTYIQIKIPRGEVNQELYDSIV